MKKTALYLIIITIFSKIIGFSREMILSYFYGASNITDIYLISTTIPSVIFGFIGVGIATGFIPMYTRIENTEGSQKSNQFTNNLINLLLVICTFLFIFGLFFTLPLVKVFASGFEGEALMIAVKYTRISLIGIYFTSLLLVFNSYLQIKGNYIIPALVGIPLNLVTILFIVISSKGNPQLLVIGTLVATISQVLFILPFVYKEGFQYRPILNIREKHIVQMIYISLPIIIGASVNQINVLVDRTIASNVAEGAISALNYADKINGIVQGVFVMSIATALYPTISKMAAKNNILGLKKTISEAITAINLVVVPTTVLCMIFSEQIVATIFGRGEFGFSALSMTSVSLFYYAIGMTGFGLREVLSRAFYSLQDTKTPAINSAIAVIVNILLNIVLSRFMGIGGLALATSISAIIGTVLLFISLRKKIGPFGIKHILRSFIKILLGSIVVGIISKKIFEFIKYGAGENLALIISMIISVSLYGVLIYFMKIEELDIFIGLIKKKTKR